MRLALSFILLAVLPSCQILEPEGRSQRSTFTTAFTREEVRIRAEGWLAERAQYDVTRSEAAFVRGEKRRPRTVGPGDQIDIQSVTIETVPEGARVEVHSQTYLATGGGGRERADELSPEGWTDHQALVQVLMARPS